MRLIAWNANFNNQKRSLEDDVALLRPFAPDIIVLSETAPPSEANPLKAIWIGDRAPGLAVIAKEGLSLTSDPMNVAAPKFMAAFTVTGKFNFQLLAIWPVQERAKGSTYHQVLMAALDRYSVVLNKPRTIMAGDLNSNTRVLMQQKTHPEFVRAAGLFGMVSVYHTHTGEEHGQETVATYRHGRSASHSFHIDYCFASLPIADAAKVTILNEEAWLPRSDHSPVILDVDDAVLVDLNE